MHSLVTSILLIGFASSLHADELLLAGGNEMFIVDTKAAETGTIEKLWRWSGEDAADLPDAARRDFNHLDECKPVENGSKILVCASNGGCAVIDRATKQILWRAHVTNAHSLALLPHDRIVIASSLSGDQLVVFDLHSQSKPVCKIPLHSAHGLVWDEQRQCLWALNFDAVRAFTLEQWDGDKPALKLKSMHALSDQDWHDLREVPRSSKLILTTEHSVQLFDRDQGIFQRHSDLGDNANIKSLDIHPTTGRIVISEWGTVVRLLHPEGTIKFKDARPYKARWL